MDPNKNLDLLTQTGTLRDEGFTQNISSFHSKHSFYLHGRAVSPNKSCLSYIKEDKESLIEILSPILCRGLSFTSSLAVLIAD